MYVQYLQGTYKCYTHRAQTMGERKTPHPPPLPSALLPPNPFIFTEIDYIRRSAHFVKALRGGLPQNLWKIRIQIVLSSSAIRRTCGGGINRYRKAPSFIVPPGSKILSTSPCSFFPSFPLLPAAWSGSIGWSALSVWATSGPPTHILINLENNPSPTIFKAFYSFPTDDMIRAKYNSYSPSPT